MKIRQMNLLTCALVLLLVLVQSGKTVPLEPTKITNGRTFGNFGPNIPNTYETFLSDQTDVPQMTAVNGVYSVESAVQFFSTRTGIPVESIKVSSYHITKHNGVTHFYLRQVVNGIEVENGVGNLSVDKEGKVVAFGSSFYQGQIPTLVQINALNSPADAVQAVAKLLGIQNVGSLVTTISQSTVAIATAAAAATISGASFTTRDIPATLKYIQIVDGGSNRHLSLVWSLEIEMVANMYNAFVDLESNNVVQLVDWISDASYNVFPFGINDPQSGGRTIVVDPARPAASPLGWHSQGTPQTTFTVTKGNNVYAQLNPSGGDEYENEDNYRPDGGGSLTFDPSLDLTQQPSAYKDAAITNLFYWNNIIHDFYYVYGFDEAAGNFQENNFGNGGDPRGDAVIAQAQDGTDTNSWNNAYFLCKPDGEKGVMKMFLWDYTNPNRDGDLDGGIIFHEYTHGLSNRLTGGPQNVNCLSTYEAGGMGEGWSDIFATITRVTNSTTRLQNYGMASYVVNAPTVRPYLYSTNMQTNPQTYSYIRRSDYQALVHRIGSVWASILYEVFWNLVDKHGFDPDWFNPTTPAKGNIIFAQLLVDGMKLQPCNPTFLTARNAILQADKNNNNGDNACEIWKGFAKRGLGILATPLTQSFLEPPPLLCRLFP